MLWPLVVYYCKPKTLLRMVIVSIPAILLLRIGLRLAGTPASYIYPTTPCRVDTLLAGSGIAILFHMGVDSAKMIRVAFIALWVSTAVLIATILADGTIHNYAPGMQTVGFTAFAIMFSSVIVLLLYGRGPLIFRRLLESRILGLLGKYSYFIYLTHAPIQGILSTYLFGRAEYEQLRVFNTVVHAQILGYFLLTVASLAAGFLSWNLFEKHFIKLKRFFPY